MAFTFVYVCVGIFLGINMEMENVKICRKLLSLQRIVLQGSQRQLKFEWKSFQINRKRNPFDGVEERGSLQCLHVKFNF